MGTDLAQSVMHLLQDQQGFITSNELAEQLSVSYKTIQRVSVELTLHMVPTSSPLRKVADIS